MAGFEQTILRFRETRGAEMVGLDLVARPGRASPVEHEDEARRGQEGPEEAEVVAPLGRPERVERQADHHHQCQGRRFDDDDACQSECMSVHLMSIDDYYMVSW
jgi:hypothetical protein